MGDEVIELATSDGVKKYIMFTLLRNVIYARENPTTTPLTAQNPVLHNCRYSS